MKQFVTMLGLAFILILAANTKVRAQGHVDPPFLQIQSAEHPIDLDGQLNETDWQRRFDHLVFQEGFKPGDVEYGVTKTLLVSGDTYLDTTTTIVRFLHRGLDLYISLQSDDKYVNKWGGSWEGDGLFMKIWDKSGVPKEFKLYFNASGDDPDMVYEESQAGSGEGVGYKMPGTVVNDTTQIDEGYTAELIIHLDQLGYSEEDTDIPVILNIFDPDKQTGTSGEEWNIGSYFKLWWGSEWGSETRILRLADPPYRKSIKTDETINLDGKLDEAFWSKAESVTVGKGSTTSTGGWYMQWGDTSNSYTDQSMAVVKFAHNGTDLYVGVQSNDSSVCEWSPGWEADGLFLWMTFKGVTPGSGDRMEIKNMYFGNTVGSGAEFQVNANVPTGGAEGASYEPDGTVTHTETNGPDSGYSLEVVIHTDLFGYSVGDTVMLSVVIWDLDYASSDAYQQGVSDYAPNWWGTQWVDPNFEKYYMYRGVILSEETAVDDQRPVKVAENFDLFQNYPNPFNPSTTISYNLPKRTDVTIEVFDLLGQKVKTLISATQSKGIHSVVWNGTDESGKKVGSGLYFYKMTTQNFSRIHKMILMK
ncbi:MAG: T9SS type A sorting domain-containing protein [Calditrichaeota bacterium]|nr:T9SS type A sorting domain-containing protein [Calditrichota bacterium]